jgi:broad specificity phosphatase PhoE
MTTRRKSPKKPESFAAIVSRGMQRAARTAREVARMRGTPIYVWEDGKVMVKKP